MEFIQELHEARLTRNTSGLKALTYTDCCERAYLTLLVLELLRRFPITAPRAHGYAKSTTGYDSYKHFRISGTDLYNFVYFIVGDGEAQDKLKDPGAAKKLRQRLQFPLMAFNRYVANMSRGFAPTPSDEQFLIRAEGVLKITNADYKSVRRNIWAFDLDAQGNISNKKLFHKFKDHGMDGMRCDIAGNLYVTRYGKGTIAKLSPQGELLLEISLKGKKPSNIAFGGKDGRTAFVTLHDRAYLETFRVEKPGRSFKQ